MASGADLFHLNQQSIAIAIESDVFHRLDVTAGFSFHPEFLARTAPEMSSARGDGFLERRAIHPGHHQHTLGSKILNDGRNQAIGGKLQLIVKTHARRTIIPQSSSASNEISSVFGQER